MTTVKWILALLYLSALSLALDGHLPPTITHGPVQFTYYRIGFSTELRCQAEGQPTPIIEWYKDGKPVDLALSRIAQKENGNLTIDPLNIRDNGTYQCFAWNRHGRAMSNYSHLVRAELAEFNDAIEEQVIDEGEPFQIICQLGTSIPVPVFEWYLVTSKTDPQPFQVDVSERVTIDQQSGKLMFSYAMLEDGSSDHLYVCRVVYNTFGLVEQGGYTQLTVRQRVDPIPLREPYEVSVRFHERERVGLVGTTLTLQCAFTGNPAPTVIWIRDTDTMPDGYNQEGSIAKISNLRDDDEGTYSCLGNNSEGLDGSEIRVDVQAAPFFANIRDRPHNKNVTRGEDVTFVCRPRGEPTPDIQWYINGEKINHEESLSGVRQDEESLSGVRQDESVPLASDPRGIPYGVDAFPSNVNTNTNTKLSSCCEERQIQVSCNSASGARHKRQISADLRTLTVYDVCENDCVGGIPDNMVIQCEASNIHGSVISNGYLNVVDIQ